MYVESAYSITFWGNVCNFEHFHLLNISFIIHCASVRMKMHNKSIERELKFQMREKFFISIFFFWSMMIECITTIESRQWKLQRWQPLCEINGDFFFLSQKLIITFDRLWHFTDSDANTNFMHTFRNQQFRRFYFYFV